MGVKLATETEKLERKFAELAQQIYESGERRIQPTWPFVLIRLAGKEQSYGSLILPDSAGSQAQNKPLWEGIVLETWKPHWSRLRGAFKGGREVEEEIWRESDFQRGDRVLFPHFAGLPVNFLDEQHYRLVREWTFDANGGAMCVVHYDADRKYKPALDKLFEGLESKTLSGR